MRWSLLRRHITFNFMLTVYLYSSLLTNIGVDSPTGRDGGICSSIIRWGWQSPVCILFVTWTSSSDLAFYVSHHSTIRSLRHRCRCSMYPRVLQWTLELCRVGTPISKDCSEWNVKKEIQRIETLQRPPYPEARKINRVSSAAISTTASMRK